MKMKVLLWYFVANVSLYSVAANILRRRKAEVKSERQMEHRIIGGTRAAAKPYFGIMDQIGCGATLIHDDIMLSAAHCYDRDPFEGTIYIGGDQLKSGLPRYAEKMIKHPDYDYWDTKYDFMIIKLNATAMQDPYWRFEDTVANTFDYEDIWGDFEVEEVTTVTQKQSVSNSTSNTGLQTITFNRDASTPQNRDPMTVMGFGKTLASNYAKLEDELYEAQVFYLDDDRCAAAYAADANTQHDYDYDPESMMCAGHPDGGYDTCNGKCLLVACFDYLSSFVH